MPPRFDEIPRQLTSETFRSINNIARTKESQNHDHIRLYRHVSRLLETTNMTRAELHQCAGTSSSFFFLGYSSLSNVYHTPTFYFIKSPLSAYMQAHTVIGVLLKLSPGAVTD